MMNVPKNMQLKIVRQAQLQARNHEISKGKNSEKVETHLNAPLVENVNRLQTDYEEARNVDKAIKILGYCLFFYCFAFKILNAFSGTSDNADNHSEKRLKAVYTAYEEENLKE
ncbi:hypothetical protein ABEB36_006391 [Hypothenemus hampei]|uniref:Coiled-coil domain-containing protein n=1 Tax=Hypothenemus hampei TaxID=57062 RepID=A0ABD1ER28_HYPHA